MSDLIKESNQLAMRILNDSGLEDYDLNQAMKRALMASNMAELAAVRRDIFPGEEAADIAKFITDKVGSDEAAQASALAMAGRRMGFAVAVFSENDCPEGVDLDDVADELEQVLVTRGNEFLDERAPTA